MRTPVVSLLACLAFAVGGGLRAQVPSYSGAGFGAVYREFELDSVTGTATHLGVAVHPGTGHYFVSAAAPAGATAHVVFEFDGNGTLVGSFAQPQAQQGSALGMRDLECDGVSLLGGSEAGISVFSPTGALVSQIEAANGPQSIVQPITGPVATQLAVFRALALDPRGNGGNGSLLVADFASPIYEIDFAGNVLVTYPWQGWSAYGLTIDPVTGNVWVLAGPNGEIEELDRTTMAPTGHRVQPVAAGAPGGLALASPVAGHHEPWGNQSALVSLVQGTTDRIAVQRLHLHPGRMGWDELQLRVGKNGGALATGAVPFWLGDTLDYTAYDPTGLRTGAPVWILFNVYRDADRRGYTNLGPVVPGVSVLMEHRSVNVLSTPASGNFLITTGTVGVVNSWSPPPSMLHDGDRFRMQALYLDPASPQAGIASTNEVWWQGQAAESGIVVAAAGATSFNGGLYPPFWTVTSDGTHAHGDITRVEFSTIGAQGPAASQLFDIDQNNMADRFDGGDSVLPGYHGTYRNGSDVACGLDYQVPGVYVAPFHLAGESAGVAFAQPPDPSGYVADLRFVFTAFVPGRTFAFDCDTDGGVPSGDGHVGMIVRVTTTASGVLTGVLQQDPLVPDRAVVWFP